MPSIAQCLTLRAEMNFKGYIITITGGLNWVSFVSVFLDFLGQFSVFYSLLPIIYFSLFFFDYSLIFYLLS